MSNTDNNMPILSTRLELAVSMVTKGYSVADIGCDHAHTSICLVKRGIAARAIAMDVRVGPLKRAEENVRLYGCEASVNTRLSDGLEKLEEGETETILITGMGGVLMTEIFKAGREKLTAAKELVLSPQSHPNLVRVYICEAGFEIDEEKMCFDAGKYYTVIHAVNKGQCEGICGEGTEYEADMLYGRRLIEKGEPVFVEYLTIERRKTLFVINQMKEQSTELSLQELPRFERKLEVIDNALGRTGSV